MQDLYQRQIDLEEEYSTASLVAGQKQVLDAFEQGRAADIGQGRILLAKSFEVALNDVTEWLKVPTRGVGGKYKRLLKIAPLDVIVMAALREIINGCASPEPMPMQNVLRNVGRIIESESMLACMNKISEKYTKRTVEYLDAAGTKSTSHRYRTFLAGSKTMGLNWDIWSTDERIGVARLLLTQLYESTGLFQWGVNSFTAGASSYFLEPSPVLAKHFQEVQGAAKAVVKYPPMLIKPNDWLGQNNGGYFTEWFNHYSPMCGIRYIKREHKQWILDHLESPVSSPVRSAMNKAQSVPYRVNKAVLQTLRSAMAMRVGILGLPSFVESPKPVFPLGDGWQKDTASAEELEQFSFWKVQMSDWYTQENKRKGRHTGLLAKISELARYQDEAELYFPTFIDWRGRLYFRSNLNPQANDAVKGCIEFAHGKRLGAVGLHWLKVHVANSCGYDKHDDKIKAAWVDDNWAYISDFINNPLDVDAPEPDTAFTLLQAGLALQEALSLDNPEDYICHVPVAMDATCSGLQHLSALTRDTTGAYYTNLIDNGTDKKSDIYMRVAEVAEDTRDKYMVSKQKDEDGSIVTKLDPVVANYWKDTPISRNMAKKPVMTFVYGSTLLSTIDSIALEMVEAGMPMIKDDSGKILYSFNTLAAPIGKALRVGVAETVPESAKMMKYLQSVVRKHKSECLRWFNPVGVPVVNWAEGTVIKRIEIKSMGVAAISMVSGNNTYNTRVAANGIVPNFVHSMDSAHLCLTILDAACDILPIHDSFATHPCDVPMMHESLRNTFIKMYKDFKIEDFLDFNNVDIEEYAPPIQGNLDLEVIKDSRFMFC